MSEVTFDVAPTTPRKRPLEEDAASETIEVSRVLSVKTEPTRDGSPTPSTSSSLTELTGSLDPGSAVKSTTSPAVKTTSTKKRKLGLFEAQAEKAAKQREKDEKARQKADEKARKEEEKARKDEEKRRAAEEKENAKRVKELEKAEKQKAKDEEKQKKEQEKALKEAEKAQKDAEKRAKDAEKEAEKQRKEADKLRKERSQMRLGSFFIKPKTEDTPPSTPDNVSEGASSRRSSVASIDMEKPNPPSLKHHDTANPEYEKYFLPFHIPEHTDVAPVNRYKRGRDSDFEITTTGNGCSLRDCFQRPRKRTRRTVPVKEIIKNMQATGLSVIDLDSNALDALARTTFKCLQFREDVRPAYTGTYTREVSPRTSKKLSRRPFSRELPETNYDYDSEAEWEPPAADDEDLDEEDEISDAEDGGDDMNDFLDDADDVVRKKGLVSDMEPISSGLCWAGQEFDDQGTNLEQYRMDVLCDSTVFPINPYSDSHWAEEAKLKVPVKQEPTSTLMQPPRQPLSSLSPNSLPASTQAIGVDGKPLPVHKNKKTTTTSKIPKMIEQELLDDFKQAVEGSDLTKLGLIEILKKQFPKCSKDVIKDTLSAVAVRVGKKETEKKWQLIDSV